MVEISLQNDRLFINGYDEPELSRIHIIKQIQRLGFEPKNDGEFICPGSNHLALANLLSLLEVRGIKYQLEHGALLLFQRFQEELELIEVIRVKGLEAQNVEAIPTITIEGFKRRLFPYQERAFFHMVTVQNPANFSVPGSGKTTMAYAYFQYLRKLGVVDKLLVIGPLSSFRVWEEEYIECINGASPINIKRFHGPNRHSIYGDDRYTIYLTNYQLVHRDKDLLISHINQTGRYLIVIDEAHYIKNPEEGAIKKALLDIAPYGVRRMIATGTPCPNSLMDLHSQLTFLWPSEGVTGSKFEFQKLIEDVEVVRSRIKPFFYRIQKKVLELDDPNITLVPIPMTNIQKQIYDSIVDKAISFITKYNVNDAQLLRWRRAWAIRLNQVMSNPSLLIDDTEDEFEQGFVPELDKHVVELVRDYHKIEIPAKVMAAMNKLQELRSKGINKVVIWTNFKKNVHMLKKLLCEKGWEVYVVTGDISSNENVLENRDQVIEEFRRTNNPAILLATPASCAEAISLHKHCHDMIFLDLTFNAAHWMQAKDRIHRIGMEKGIETNYYVIQTENSYDQTIYDRVLQKENKMIAVCNSDLPMPTENDEEISFEGFITNEDEIFSALDAELAAWESMNHE